MGRRDRGVAGIEGELRAMLRESAELRLHVIDTEAGHGVIRSHPGEVLGFMSDCLRLETRARDLGIAIDENQAVSYCDVVTVANIAHRPINQVLHWDSDLGLGAA
jgi:hypothetical protein